MWRGELHLDHPALLVRVVVDPLRSVDELLVHLGDLARDRREQLAHRLGALHHAERLAAHDLRAHFRQLQINHVAELILGEAGDAHGRPVAGDPRPLVLLGVLQAIGVIGHRFPLRRIWGRISALPS